MAVLVVVLEVYLFLNNVLERFLVELIWFSELVKQIDELLRVVHVNQWPVRARKRINASLAARQARSSAFSVIHR